jgi:MerR family transcriptional regulator, light-induced transcriptional regulator
LGRTLLVPAGEAARRLGVSPVTIQRWADQGLIAVERTAGGHRRVPVSEVLRLLAASRPVPSGPLADWVETLMSGDPDRVFGALQKRRAEVECWSKVADEVSVALNEIGRAWDVGDCTIFEEHLASEALRRGAIRCLSDLPAAPDAPRGALLTTEDERHTLGLSLSELVFAENGWKTIWIGEGPPTNELEYMIETLKPDAVAVSASASRSAAALRQYQRALSRLASTGQFYLLLAGGAPWPVAPESIRISSFEELDRWLKDSHAEPPSDV